MPELSNIDALIFDLGGVIIDLDLQGAYRDFAYLSGKTVEEEIMKIALWWFCNIDIISLKLQAEIFKCFNKFSDLHFVYKMHPGARASAILAQNVHLLVKLAWIKRIAYHAHLDFIYK